MATPAREANYMTGEHGSAIARLSSELKLPFHEVAAVYRAQLDEIGESARIQGYLSVLAGRRARSILRGSRPIPESTH